MFNASVKLLSVSDGLFLFLFFSAAPFYILPEKLYKYSYASYSG